jgi:hypothetical protein
MVSLPSNALVTQPTHLLTHNCDVFFISKRIPRLFQMVSWQGEKGRTNSHMTWLCSALLLLLEPF